MALAVNSDEQQNDHYGARAFFLSLVWISVQVSNVQSTTLHITLDYCELNDGRRGRILFYDFTFFDGGESKWIGIELMPGCSPGDHDGNYKGHTYFVCEYNYINLNTPTIPEIPEISDNIINDINDESNKNMVYLLNHIILQKYMIQYQENGILNLNHKILVIIIIILDHHHTVVVVLVIVIITIACIWIKKVVTIRYQGRINDHSITTQVPIRFLSASHQCRITHPSTRNHFVMVCFIVC